MKNKIQLDATYYFIMLMLSSTCFGHHYAHHQELTTLSFGYHIGRLVLELLLVGSKVQAGWMSVRTEGCYTLRSEHSSILPALNLQPAATREPDGLCGNQTISS